MNWRKSSRVIFKLMAIPVGILVVLTLFSATEARRSGKIDKILVDIRPIENKIFLLTNDDLARDLNKSIKSKIKGQSLESLDLTEIEKVVEENIFVKDAQVYVDARQTLQILVDQKRPVVRVINSSNENFYIDEGGNKIPLSMNAILRLPVLTGDLPAYKRKMSEDKKSKYYSALKIIKAIGEDPFMMALTEQLLVETNGDVSLIPKVGHHKIIVGNGEDLQAKFNKLEIFYKKGMPANGWNTYSEVNLKYKNQVVAKKAPQEEIKN